MLVGWLAVLALAAWVAVLLLPSRPWSTRERIEPAAGGAAVADAAAVTVVIPARNEAASIGPTLRALADQSLPLSVVVVDDESGDGTARAAAAAADALRDAIDFRVIAGQPLPQGWGGKLWALEQGLGHVDTAYCLLLDAEISLAPGIVRALLDKAERERRALVSVMARLRCETIWEQLLVPPFIFFFKLLYPFARVNAPARRAAAAAGGCILIRTEVLRQLGGFAPMRDALIDDCTLAARVKRAGHSIWLGLSEAVTSTRAYPDLASFRRMVTRTAFTQLGYSYALLLLVVVLMLVMFVVPWLALFAVFPGWAALTGVLAVLAMAVAYWPTVRFYGLAPGWTLTLPLAAVLFLAMTLESAWNYRRGIRARWKGRSYAAR